MKFVALDLETTGLDPENEEIIEIAAIKFENGRAIDTFNELINPGKPIPAFVQNITGIDDEMVKDAKSFEDVRDALEDFVSDYPILGQNIQFDINFLATKGLVFENDSLDTFILARAIIPKAQSYSLEILADQLDLVQESAHRAYDDALASVHLMEKLRIMLLKEDGETLQKIANFLEAQEYSWKEFFLEGIKNKDNFKEEIDSYKESLDVSEHGAPHIEESHEMKEIELTGKKVTEGYIDPERYNFSEQTLLAMPGSKTYYYPKQTYRLRYNYLIPEKFEKLLERDQKWSEEEITAIIKLLIWFNHTETYETSELKLYSKEYNVVNEVSLDEEEEHDIFETKLSKLKKQNKIYISHSNLLKAAILDIDLGIDIKNLVVLDGLNFEKYLSKASVLTIGINDFNPSGEMLFGMLGIIFEKFKPRNLGFPEFELEGDAKSSPEYKKAIDLIKTGLAELKNPPAKLNILKQYLETPDKFTFSLLKTQDEDILIRIGISDFLEFLNEKLWNRFENVIINDDVTQHKGNEFLKNALRLQNFEFKHLTTNEFDFKPFPDLPDMKSFSFLEEAVKVIESESTNHKNSLLIYPSTSQIGTMLDLLQASDALSDHTILGQGSSGSNGKIIKKLNPEGNNILLVTFEFALELIEIFKDLKFNDFGLFFTKMPFMHPKHNYLQYISSFYLDSYETYELYSVPKAFCIIHKTAKRYSHTFDNVRSYVLDKKLLKYT